MTMRNEHRGDDLRCRALLHEKLLIVVTLAIVIMAAVTSCTPNREPQQFAGDSAYAYLTRICEFGPHPVGSEAQQKVRDYIAQELSKHGWDVQIQPFVYRGITGYNVLAHKGEGDYGVLLGAHYDTRPYADRNPPSSRDQPILGANDGGSGSAVLLELARVLEFDRGKLQVWLAFFDAEDRGNLEGWPFSVGAEFVASLGLPLDAVVVVDMVGDAEQQFYFDGNSHPELSRTLWELAAELGYSEHFIPRVKYHIIDDHIPFARRGIPAVDIIDFDYPYWHATEDTPEKVSPESPERVGRLLEAWIEKHDAAFPLKRAP